MGPMVYRQGIIEGINILDTARVQPAHGPGPAWVNAAVNNTRTIKRYNFMLLVGINRI